MAATIAATQCGPAITASAEEAHSRLSPANFTELHTLIRPHENEWRHLRVDWLTDVVAARRKAAAEDKPIVICYTGGAGYNEPLGTC
jgi:hypothetical protein